MQITISDKVIAQAVGYVLECNVYDYFDKATIKAAGVPKKADAVKAVMADDKFLKKMAKLIAESVEDLDMLSDFVYEIDYSVVGQLVDDCERVSDAMAEERAAQREAEEVTRMVKTLEKAGFKIVKA